MKRLSALFIAALAVLAIAPSAFAAEHAGPFASPKSQPVAGSVNVAHAGGLVVAAAGRGLAAFRSGLTPSMMRLARRSLSYGGSSNIGTDTPFLPYPSEVPSGAVDAAGHADDVYMFYLEAGAEMDFHLDTANHGAQVSLRLFSPDATDIHVDSPIAEDATFAYPTDDAFVAPADGYYAIDVHAVNGATAYTLNYDWFMGPNDNVLVGGVPAPLITASPTQSWLDSAWDSDDVYSVPLHAGDTLKATLTPVAEYSSNDIDLDLYMYNQVATNIYPHDWNANTTIMAHSANDAPMAETITRKVSVTARYYLDVNCYAGWGVSNLAWSVSPVRPAISRAPSAANVTYTRKGGVAKFTLSANYKNQVGIGAVAGQIYLQTSANGKTWKNTYKLTTNANGNVSKTISAKSKGVTYYRWEVLQHGSTLEAHTGTQKVTIK